MASDGNFTLSGGVRAVLRRMDVHRCPPDIKTFFYLLKALPFNKEAEDKLISIMKVSEVALRCVTVSYRTHTLASYQLESIKLLVPSVD